MEHMLQLDILNSIANALAPVFELPPIHVIAEIIRVGTPCRNIWDGASGLELTLSATVTNSVIIVPTNSLSEARFHELDSLEYFQSPQLLRFARNERLI